MAGSLTKNLNFVLLGKDVSASKSMSGVQKAASEMTEKVGGKLSSLGSMVGGEFGEILSQAGDGVEGVGKHVQNMGTVVAAGGGVLAGAGVAMQNFASGGEQATAQLKTAIENSGGSWDKYEKQVDAVVKTGANFGDNTATVENALTTMTDTTGNAQEAVEYLGVAEDLAANKHESLGSAAEQVSKILAGTGTRTLKQYGITMATVVDPAKAMSAAQKKVETTTTQLGSAQDKLTRLEKEYAGQTHLSATETAALQKAHDAVKTAMANHAAAEKQLAAAQHQGATNSQNEQAALGQLAAKISGDASDAADTFSGKITALRTHMEDWAEDMSGKVGPTLTAVGGGATAVGTAMDLLKGTSLGAKLGLGGVKIASEAVTAGEKTMAVATKAGTVAQEAQTVADRMASTGKKTLAASTDEQKVAQEGATVATDEGAVAQDGLNVAMDANPIGLVTIAIAALVAGLVWFFTQTKLGRTLWSDFVGAIQTGWKAVTSFVDFDRWGADFTSMWSGIETGATSAWQWISGQVDNFANGVIDDVNTMINGLNGAIGLIDKIPGVHIGTIPDIPHLASGGIVTSPTLALIGESGPEQVMPLNGGRIGSGDSGSGDVNVYVTVPSGFIGNTQELARAIQTVLISGLRGGSISRAELKQAMGVS